MAKGSGVGLIRMGNLGGKLIATLTAISTSPASCQEAYGLRNWTFESQGTFTATVEVDGTLDAATAAGTASNWFKIGDISTPNTPLTFQGSLKAVRANCTAFTSGTANVYATATS